MFKTVYLMCESCWCEVRHTFPQYVGYNVPLASLREGVQETTVSPVGASL